MCILTGKFSVTIVVMYSDCFMHYKNFGYHHLANSSEADKQQKDNFMYEIEGSKISVIIFRVDKEPSAVLYFGLWPKPRDGTGHYIELENTILNILFLPDC